MSATRAPRRRRHRGADHTFLRSLATIVDEATTAASGHVLVHVAGPIHPDVHLGLRPLADGVHPFDELAGQHAPEEWTVFGLRVTGRSRSLDDPDAPPRRMSSVFLLDRFGREASLLRHDDEVVRPGGPAVGTIPDVCRRVLQLPTEPAPPTTAPLWAAMWLDRIVDRWGQPHRRADLTSFAELAILHPAVHEPSPPDVLAVADPASLARVARPYALATTWAQLRRSGEPFPLPDGPLDPAVAGWMDDGFFARWTMGAHPPLQRTALELRHRLGDPLGPQLIEALVRLLEG